MLQIEIHRGTADDAVLIADLIRHMVVEMEGYGGHTVNTSPEIWSSMADLVKAHSARPEYLYLIASQGPPEQTVIGLTAANIEPLVGSFAARTRLHLSAIYTIPSVRRQGVASQLIRNVLEWGQQMNAVEADLNVLVANPARRLYEQLGFQPLEISMVKTLGSEQSADQRRIGSA